MTRPKDCTPGLGMGADKTGDESYNFDDIYDDDDVDVDDEDDDDLYIIGAVCPSVRHKSDYFAVSPKSAYK